MLNSSKFFFYLSGLSFLLSGCATERINTGYQYENASLNSIVVLKSSASDVMRILGTPTAESDFGPKTYLYIGAKYDKKAFFDQKLVEQRIISILFNNSDIVDKLTIYDTKDARNLAFSKDEIKIAGNEVSLWKQMLKNLGRFDKSSNRN